jgi:hypothetical protein
MRPSFHLSYRSPNTHYKHYCIERDISCVSEEWIKQGRQCTINVISRRVPVTIVAEEKPLVLHILSVRLRP